MHPLVIPSKEGIQAWMPIFMGMTLIKDEFWIFLALVIASRLYDFQAKRSIYSADCFVSYYYFGE